MFFNTMPTTDAAAVAAAAATAAAAAAAAPAGQVGPHIGGASGLNPNRWQVGPHIGGASGFVPTRFHPTSVDGRTCPQPAIDLAGRGQESPRTPLGFTRWQAGPHIGGASGFVPTRFHPASAERRTCHRPAIYGAPPCGGNPCRNLAHQPNNRTRTWANWGYRQGARSHHTHHSTYRTRRTSQHRAHACGR